MNWKRGLFRLWYLISALWLITVSLIAFFIVFEFHPAFSGKYEATYVTRGNHKPWEIDWTWSEGVNFYDIFKRPSEMDEPTSFYYIEHRYLQDRYERAKRGLIEVVDFPDGTQLYADAAYGKDELAILSRWFWQARWRRRAKAIYPVVVISAGFPLIVLVLGLAVSWVASGFRQPPRA